MTAHKNTGIIVIIYFAYILTMNLNGIIKINAPEHIINIKTAKTRALHRFSRGITKKEPTNSPIAYTLLIILKI